MPVKTDCRFSTRNYRRDSTVLRNKWKTLTRGTIKKIGFEINFKTENIF